MFDTVRFALEDCWSRTDEDTGEYSEAVHRDILWYFQEMDGKTVYQSEKSQGGYLHSKVTQNRRKNTYTETVSWLTKNNPSSNYDINIFCDPQGNRVVFEFSLPKYFYGTNVLQLVMNPGESDFYYCDNFKVHTDQAYDRLMRCIHAFFSVEFPTVKVDYTKVKILRIDVCFNQVFHSKADALTYLKYMTRVPKKYSRTGRSTNNYKDLLPENGGALQDRVTGISEPGGREYHFKVYHKGTEYTKNDRREHEKFNEKQAKKRYPKKLFNVEELQDLADRTLRYELTVRPAYMSYLYAQKVLRKNNQDFAIMRKLFNRLKGVHGKKKGIEYDEFKPIIEEYERVHIGKMTDDIVTAICHYYRYETRGLPIDFDRLYNFHAKVNSLNKFYRDMDIMMNKERSFYVRLNGEEYRHYFSDVTTNNLFVKTANVVELNKLLVKEICKNFWERVKDKQVKDAPTIQQISDRIDEYNNGVELHNQKVKDYPALAKVNNLKPKTKLDRGRLLFMVVAMQKTSLKDLQVQLSIPKSTFFRYQKELANVGIDKHMTNRAMPIAADLSFKGYYETVMYKDVFNSDVGSWLFSKV